MQRYVFLIPVSVLYVLDFLTHVCTEGEPLTCPGGLHNRGALSVLAKGEHAEDVLLGGHHPGEGDLSLV